MKLKRINLIIGKKQLILAGLTLLLGAAIYVNFVNASAGVKAETGKSPETTAQAGANYGDVEFVSSSAGKDDSSDPDDTETVAADTYFAQARLDKQERRDEAL